MYILGLNVFHGDASACIFKDGELICAAEDGRWQNQRALFHAMRPY